MENKYNELFINTVMSNLKLYNEAKKIQMPDMSGVAMQLFRYVSVDHESAASDQISTLQLGNYVDYIPDPTDESVIALAKRVASSIETILAITREHSPTGKLVCSELVNTSNGMKNLQLKVTRIDAADIVSRFKGRNPDTTLDDSSILDIAAREVDVRPGEYAAYNFFFGAISV